MALLSPDSPAGATALIEEATGRRWTYGQLRDEVGRIAAKLGSRKRLIFVFAANRAESVIAFLAAIEGDHAVCLLDASGDDSIKSALVERYQPNLVFDPSSLEPSTPFAVDGGLYPELSLLLPTSGTTGSPKLVRLTRSNVLSNARSIATYLRLDPAETTLTSLPIHYSYGLSVLNSHLHSGGSVLLTERSAIRPEFWKVAADHAVTSLAGVPYSYALLARLAAERFFPPSLKTLTQAGGRLSEELVMRFHRAMEARGGRFFVMYGQTEATARMSYVPPERLADKLGTVGIAIPDGQLRVENDEVIYSGPNVMLGYASERADLEKGDELHGELRTGDLGFQDADGYLHLTGRLKRIAKVFGLRLNLDEVEAAITGFDAVAAIPGDERVVVFCVGGSNDQRDAVRADLSRRLRLNANALEFRTIDALPVTASGKVDYQRLQEQA